MRSRFIRSLAWGIAAGVTGLLVLMALLAWRLSQGPVALGFLVPTIERALSQPDRGLFVRVDRVIVDSIGFLRFEAEGVRVVDGAGVSVVGTPHIRLALSSRALARGIVAPSEIQFSGVRVRLSRSEDGAIQLGLDRSAAPGSDADAAWIIADLLQPPDPARVTGYLRRVAVDDAEVLVRDARLGRSWRIPHADFELLRGDREVVTTIGGVLDVDGRPQRTDVEAHFDLDTGTATVDIGLVDVRPDVVTQLLPTLGLLGAFDAPISGGLSFRMSRRGDIEDARVRLDGGAGSVGLPGSLSGEVPPIPVDAMTLRGAMTGPNHFRVEEFSVDAAGQHIAATGDLRWSQEGSRAGLRFEGVRPALLGALSPDLALAAGIDVPLDGWVELFLPGTGAPASVAFGVQSDGGQVVVPDFLPEPVRVSGLELRGAADLDAGRLKIERFALGLGGPRIEGAATMRTLHGGAVVQADVTARDVPTDELHRLWPVGVAKGARRWVLEHLSEGGVSEAKARAALVLSEGARIVPMASVTGELHFQDVTAVYWDPLPPFLGVAGSATFTEDRFDLRVDRGRSGNIEARGGEMAFTNLSDGLDREFADIAVSVGGPLSEVITVLDRPPLEYAKWLRVDPSAVGGNAEAELRVQLPLLETVTLDQIEIGADASLTGVLWPDAALGQDLREGDLKLRLDKNSMDLTGEGTLAGARTRIDLHEVFAGGTTLKAEAVVDDAARRILGYDLVPYLTGPVPVRVSMEGTRRRSEVVAQLDLTGAELALSEAGWRKAAGTAAEAEAELVLADGRLAGVERFSLRAPGADVAGRASVDPETGTPRRIEFPRLQVGERTDVGLVVDRDADGGYRIDARGASVDLGPLLDGPPDDGPGEEATRGESSAEPAAAWPPIAVVADVARVWIGDELPIDGVAGHMSWRDGGFGAGEMHGRVGGTAPVHFVATESGTQQTVVLSGDDFGNTLRAAGVFDTIAGGTFELSATRALSGAPPAGTADAPYVGDLEVDAFRLIRAPLAARLFAAAALTGLADLASADEGIAFSRLTAPFEFRRGALTLRPGRAYGPSVGMTWRGGLDFDANTVDVAGTLVPFYAVNRIIGSVPLIGDLLTGGKGGGVFAVTYGMTGDLDEPDMAVNPLSLLAPGFLRGLFGALAGSGDGQWDPSEDPSLQNSLQKEN